MSAKTETTHYPLPEISLKLSEQRTISSPKPSETL